MHVHCALQNVAVWSWQASVCWGSPSQKSSLPDSDFLGPKLHLQTQEWNRATQQRPQNLQARSGHPSPGLRDLCHSKISLPAVSVPQTENMGTPLFCVCVKCTNEKYKHVKYSKRDVCQQMRKEGPWDRRFWFEIILWSIGLTRSTCSLDAQRYFLFPLQKCTFLSHKSPQPRCKLVRNIFPFSLIVPPPLLSRVPEAVVSLEHYPISWTFFISILVHLFLVACAV